MYCILTIYHLCICLLIQTMPQNSRRENVCMAKHIQFDILSFTADNDSPNFPFSSLYPIENVSPSKHLRQLPGEHGFLNCSCLSPYALQLSLIREGAPHVVYGACECFSTSASPQWTSTSATIWYQVKRRPKRSQNGTITIEKKKKQGVNYRLSLWDRKSPKSLQPASPVHFSASAVTDSSVALDLRSVRCARQHIILFTTCDSQFSGWQRPHLSPLTCAVQCVSAGGAVLRHLPAHHTLAEDDFSVRSKELRWWNEQREV